MENLTFNQNFLGGNSTTSVMPTSTPVNVPIPEPAYVFFTVTFIYIFVFLFGILGNILVIYVVCTQRDMLTPTNMFLVNLSVADLLVLLVCMPSSLVEFHAREVWLLGDSMCKCQRNLT